jgi:hypothetical protein
MAIPKQSLIVDRYGKPLALSSQRYSSTSRQLYSPSYTSNRYFGGSNQDPYKFLNPSERRLINQFALDLFRSSPVIHSAITKKNEWACATAWKPMFRGNNTDWGKKALNYLNTVAYPNCSVGGSNMTFNRLLLTISNQLDISGDVLLVYVTTRDGLGRIALYPSNMVGHREFGKATVQDGRYKGASIDDGVICNSSNTPIAFRILQDKKEDDFDVSSRDAQLLFEPNELTNRGISVIAPSLLTFLSVDEISTALNRMVFNESKTGLVVSTDTGTGEKFVDGDNDLMAADTAGSTVSSGKFEPKIVDLGDVTFLSAKNGEKVESLKTDRPHSNAQEWIRYLTETVVSDLGWSLALISPEKLTGANAKMLESQVQQTISVRQQTLKRVANLFTLFALTKGMENGDVPKINTNDWRQWEWSLPAEFVINGTDAGDIQGINAGTKTLQEVTARGGGDWLEIRNQRTVELEDAITRADNLVTKSGGKLSFERALTLIGVGSVPQVAPLSEQTISTTNK